MSGLHRVTVLGATGSVGANTLDVMARHPDRFVVEALTAHTDADGLAAACARSGAKRAVIADPDRHDALVAALAEAGSRAEALAGPAALVDVAADGASDSVMAAIVGAAGLPPTLAAARAGKRVLLANKEALVVAGALFMDAARAAGACVVPVDSEHNGLFQALPRGLDCGGFPGGLSAVGVDRLLLTASGGPFLDTALDELAAMTPEQACAHPNWDMGRKISVDSATLMNKGLEVIEACWLFGAGREQIGVVMHPQSIVHALVEMRDGSVLAQLGAPDMRTPIAQALAWPDRIASGAATLDLVGCGPLDFREPDFDRFPCLGLAFAALEAGGSAPLVLNAANEIAVEAFLDRRIRFTDIHTVVAGVLEDQAPVPGPALADLLEADRWARERAWQQVQRREQANG